jgi:hypothetical protein
VIKSRRVDVQWVSEANVEPLQKEFGEISFKEAKSVDDFSMHITRLTNNISVLGGRISETEIMRKISLTRE